MSDGDVWEYRRFEMPLADGRLVPKIAKAFPFAETVEAYP
jgi:hypothetical protein